ncbi:hypothetical protein BWQ96_02523 [Gracilariopsis chorda]|uniref:Uncharacterized protein n=1 Tax=Gracilariopsis chorda TaxID=448386 RepID=A0A2V3IZT8_9FLOR|nr:hypothetical protein BWQ96_02523 [Gracilariopsis chorda]|eukprot:PXF47661.1 hypothetical protein BWQ96_02523 [Gracilariopsis chorda]
MNVMNPIRSTARIALRSYSTPPSSSTRSAHIIYNNPRRLRAAGMTLLAVGQAGFWGMATALAQQAPEPLISSGWTVAGVGLSAAFAAMVNAYLRRNVAEIALLNGASIRVTAHSFGGMLSTPVVFTPHTIVRGPKRDDPSERYWTFGVKSSSPRPFYYFVDTSHGVLDRHALAALVNGGEHLMAFSHKRDAQIMTSRWHQWQQISGKQ